MSKFSTVEEDEDQHTEVINFRCISNDEHTWNVLVKSQITKICIKLIFCKLYLNNFL